MTSTRIQTEWLHWLGISKSESQRDAVLLPDTHTHPLTDYSLDECFKGAAYSWETLTDPSVIPVEEHIHTPLNKAYNLPTPVPYFKFLQRADQASRRLRFDASMQGMERMQPPDVTLNGMCFTPSAIWSINLLSAHGHPAFEWGKLAKGSKIVDIGGGIGNVFFPVAEHYPELNIIIQDLPGVVENAKKALLSNPHYICCEY